MPVRGVQSTLEFYTERRWSFIPLHTSLKASVARHNEALCVPVPHTLSLCLSKGTLLLSSHSFPSSCLFFLPCGRLDLQREQMLSKCLMPYPWISCTVYKMACENEKDLSQDSAALATLTVFNTGRQLFSLKLLIFAEAIRSLFTSDMVVNTAVEYFQ